MGSKTIRNARKIRKVATSTLIGRTTSGTGVAEELTPTQARSLLSVYTTTQTDSAISTAVNTLVAGAPGLLDTLDELSAALGDDANFASTVTTALAGKVDSSSLSESIDDRVAALLVSGTNISITYNDAANTLTITNTAGTTAPGGSSGQVQYNDAGAFGGMAAVVYATTVTHVTITSQAASTVPFCVKGAASQSGNLSEWRNSAGTLLLCVTSAGIIGNASGYGFSMDTIYGHAFLRATTGRQLYIGTSDSNQLAFVSGGSVRVEVIGTVMRPRFATWLGEVSFQWPGAYIQKLLTNIAATTDVGHTIQAFSGQTANLSEWQNSSGTVLSAIAKNGALKIVSLADSAAENSTLYYSTDASALVWKDSGGTVHALY